VLTHDYGSGNKITEWDHTHFAVLTTQNEITAEEKREQPISRKGNDQETVKTVDNQVRQLNSL